MSTPRLIRFAALSPSPWANGLGTTVELLRVPPRGEFDVRLSLATVGPAAPFSLLPGVDRVLMALSEGGLSLVVGGVQRHVDHQQTLAFAGEDDVSSAGGAGGLDLNLMVRRGGGVPRLQRVAVAGRWESPRDAVAVVALDGALTALGARLEFGDTLVGGGAALRGAGTVAVATLG
jgi:environmental stress-induced protein Ves